MVDVTYQVPKDVAHMPRDGTGTRELVIGFLSSTDDVDNCWESRYGIVREYDDWKRLHQFITVRTRKASIPDPANRDEEDVAFGLWRSWALYYRTMTGGRTEYALHELRRGAYVRCGSPHNRDCMRPPHVWSSLRVARRSISNAMAKAFANSPWSIPIANY